MAAAQRSQLWDQTCAVVATLYNVNRGKSGRTVKPDDLHPYRRRKRPQATPESTKEGFRLMRQAILGDEDEE